MQAQINHDPDLFPYIEGAGDGMLKPLVEKSSQARSVLENEKLKQALVDAGALMMIRNKWWANKELFFEVLKRGTR